MGIAVLDSSAWREFRGHARNCGWNKTTHLAVISDHSGGLHNCFVKLLPINEPGLLGEAIGWLLAKASGVPCVAFAAIVMVPLDHLRKNISLPSEYDGMTECPAWCSEVIRGKTVLQINQWAFLINRRNCLESVDSRKIAAFDVWTDLKDRNFGNVIRSSKGGYVALDHESILHDLLSVPFGLTFELRSLMEEARKHLSPKNFQRFQVDMAKSAELHESGISSTQSDIVGIIDTIYPAFPAPMKTAILAYLATQSQTGWLAKKIGVIA